MANELISTNDSIESQLAQQVNAYCSFTAETLDQKAMLFNAMNNPDYRVGDMINQVIRVQDVYAEYVNMTNEETGEVEEVPRVVLFDDQGKSYVAVSKGIYNALKKLFLVFGVPAEWDAPLALKVKQVNIRERKMLTLEISK